MVGLSMYARLGQADYFAGVGQLPPLPPPTAL